MAVIYGMADTEKRLLDKLPNKVKSIDDISQVHKDMKDDYTLMGTSSESFSKTLISPLAPLCKGLSLFSSIFVICLFYINEFVS